MRIAVIGAGGVGAVFGGALARAGEEVWFVARGETLRALETDGLRIEAPGGDMHLPAVRATEDPSRIGPVDAVLVAVKAGQVAGVAPMLAPLVGGATVVIPLQNGVEAPAQLADALGQAHVTAGFCRVLAERVAPARVRLARDGASVAFGWLPGAEVEAAKAASVVALRAAFRRARVTVEEHADVWRAMWEKFLFIEPLGVVGAAARVGVGAIMETVETRALFEACQRELVAVAVARGVGLDEGSIAVADRITAALPRDATTSMQRDLVGGRPSELEAQTGAVVRMAREGGISAPVHDALYAVLLPQEGAAGRVT